MSVRRDTANRLTLFRNCAICGKSIVTTAETPWMRLVEQREGGQRRQRINYYCSATCKAASYKHRFDGKAMERKRARDAARNTKEKNRKYYAAHKEQLREKARARYWADPESARLNNAYAREKKEMIAG